MMPSTPSRFCKRLMGSRSSNPPAATDCATQVGKSVLVIREVKGGIVPLFGS